MISIERLGTGDLSKAKALFVLLQQEDNISQTTLTDDQNHLEQIANDAFIVLAAYANEQLVGSITAFQLKMYKHKRSKMLLYEIGIKSSYRRQGIGTTLFDKLITLSKERNVDKIIILTVEINQNAMAFYKKNNAQVEIEGRILMRPC